MKTNIQLERQAVTHKGILDFTVDRLPEIPNNVLTRFPELRQTAADFDRLRNNLQLQLREQFVALRGMLDKTASVESVSEINNFLTREIKTVQKDLTVITNNIVQEAAKAAVASQTQTGTVKTDKTVPDPVVYLSETVDELISQVKADAAGPILQIINNLNELTTEFNDLVSEQSTQFPYSILTPTNPVTITHNRSVRPSSVRVMTTPNYEAVDMFRSDDSTLGTTILTFGYNFGPGLVILGFS